MQEYKNDIDKLMETKELIYNRILDLLEKKAQSGGSSNIIFFKDVVVRKPNININQHERILQNIKIMENNNHISLKEAMTNSFNRIKRNNT